MSAFQNRLVAWYSKTLTLYPRKFRDEFAEEMQVVFRDTLNEAFKNGILELALVCLRELVELPFNILKEFWHEIKRKEINMITSETTRSEMIDGKIESPWSALIGTIPFVLFGIASMIGKSNIPFHSVYAFLVFYAIALAGLLIGITKHFPRWSYSYLGWSLVFAWWWSNMGTYGLRIFGFRMDYWTWQIWIPLLTTIGIALLWTRSLRPLQLLVRGIWQDWTLASFMMYTFVAWMGLLYDENHHPYLIAFMIGSTLAISIGAWFFLSRNQTQKRIIALLSSFVAVAIITAISESTWNWREYYSLPPQPPVAWYVSALRILVIMTFWGVILFWPAILGVIKRAIYNRKMV